MPVSDPMQIPLPRFEACLNCSTDGIRREKKMNIRALDPNVNITMGDSEYRAQDMAGKVFPCPLCGLSLGIRIARTQKPYCICIDCGIQLFIRGKTGISRLKKIIENELLIAGKDSNANFAAVLFNRIQHLKRQKSDLEARQGLIIRDSDLENTILAVDNEIERVQGELEKLGRKTPRGKTK
jgi:hypothetical protein